MPGCGLVTASGLLSLNLNCDIIEFFVIVITTFNFDLLGVF